MTSRSFLISGLVLMLLGVILGAFGAHAIRELVTAKQMNTWQTASEYHFYHALALIGLGIWGEKRSLGRLVRASGVLFIAGVTLFSGSLYLLVLTGISWLGMVTPIGGLLFILAWLSWLASVSVFESD